MASSLRISPKVSIVIPTHNRVELLEETVASVRAQTYANWEAIVIDDRSTDATPQYLKQISREDPRFLCSDHSTDPAAFAGANAARNHGITIATGDLFIFLDSDDLLAPTCLERRVRQMHRRPDLDFGVWATRCFKKQPSDTPLLWNVLVSPEPDLHRFLLLDGPWQTTGAIWTRRAITRMGPWDEQLLSLQDWEWHVRAIGRHLRYEKFEEADNFYRLPFARNSITDSQRSGRHYASHARALARFVRISQHNRAFDETARDLLLPLSRFFAERCATTGRYHAAVSLWRACHQTGLIDWRRYAEGIVYFRAWHTHRLKNATKRYVAKHWPRDIHSMWRKTIYQTPVRSSDNALVAI